jgi:hypothetical protein
MGTKIGTAIPGLKKPKKVNTAREVAKTAPGVAGSAVGAAQAGFGASRGLALREGLRAASANVGQVAEQTRLAAANDAAMNIQNTNLRNERLAAFGTDAAKGLADMGAAMIKPGANSPQSTDNAAGIPVGGGQVVENAAPPADWMGANQAPMAGTPEQQFQAAQMGQDAMLPQDQQKLNQVSALEGDPGFGNVPLLDQLQQQADQAAGPTAAFQLDPVQQVIQSRPPALMPEIEKELGDRLHMKELMLSEGLRLGIDMSKIIARANRRLQLRPGQSTNNPHGVSLMGGEQ